MVPNAKTDRLEDAAQARASRGDAPRVLRLQDLQVESPARRLQLELEKSWAPTRPAERWSARRSLFFIVLTNGLLWTALIWSVAHFI